MSVRRAISEFRDVTVAFENGVDAQLVSPIDAYKGAIEKVEQIEGVYATKGSFVDLTDKTIFVTGTQLHKIYVFDLTTVVATGAYTFVFVEVRPNALNEA
jgi:hypothetical protein